MKKKIPALIFSALIIVNFTACTKTEKIAIDPENTSLAAKTEQTEKNTANNNETSAQYSDEDITKKDTEADFVPDISLLEGEWTLHSGIVDGYEYSAEEAGYATELSIGEKSAHYLFSSSDITQSFDAELELLDTPLYEGCENNEWSVKFILKESDFDDEEEFYATLIDEETLLFQHFFSI